MAQKAEAGALAPVGQPMTVAQVISAVEVRVDELVALRLAEFDAEIAECIAAGAMLENVTDDEGAEAIADSRKKTKALITTINNNRLELTRRTDALKNRIKGPYDKKIDQLETSVAAQEASVRPYLEQKQRERDEEEARIRKARRDADEAAAAEKKKKDDEARAAREEEERLEREQQQAKSKKERERIAAELSQARMKTDETAQAAEVAQTVADAASAPVSTRAASASVKSVGGSSLGMRKEWAHEVTDFDALPPQAKMANDAWIKAQYANEDARKLIADRDGNPQIPGVRIFQRPAMAGR